MADLCRRIEVYRCPAWKKTVPQGSPEWTLHYTINSIDFQFYAETRSYRPAPYQKVNSVPNGPLGLAYLFEVNSESQSMPPTGFGGWNVYFPQHTTFNPLGAKNPDPRMINATDKRHLSRTTLVFLDGHTESKALAKEQMPFALFNPLSAKP